MVKNKTVKTVPRHRRKNKKHRTFLTLIVALLMIALICGLLLGGYVMALAVDLPEITAEDLVTAQTSFVYDSNGNQIASLHGGENRISVNLDQMPQYLIDAVVSSEDIRFYQHHGVDFRSVMRAVVVDIRDTIRYRSVTFSQGASTITMQLVKNVVDETEKTLPRKIKQALLAIEFEKNYTKDEILYYYLNEIYMAPSAFGMQAAAEYYFNKDVQDITLAEAATLAAILRAPGLYDPYTDAERVLDVRNAVLNAMVTYDPDYESQVAAAKVEPLAVYEGTSDQASSYEYPWFVDYVVSETMELLEKQGMEPELVYTGGLHIYTTLDVDVQQSLESAFADPSNFPASYTGDRVESAMVILETDTGQIKGLVGGREYTTRRGFNRASDLRRSPGSTIKPCVAMAGLEEGVITKDTYITCTGKYRYYEDYQPGCTGIHGGQNVVYALYHSCNIFFYETSRLLGIEKLNRYFTMFGLGEKTGVELNEAEGTVDSYLLRTSKGELWTPGLTIQAGIGHGDNQFTPIQLCTYVSTIANKGVRYKAHLVKSVLTNDFSKTVYQSEHEILSQANFKAENWDQVWQGMLLVGTKSYADFSDVPVNVAAKTGTTTVEKWIDGYKVDTYNGLILTFAPYEDPEICVAVVIEGAGSGGSTAPVASKIMEYYFSTKTTPEPAQEEGTLLR